MRTTRLFPAGLVVLLGSFLADRAAAQSPPSPVGTLIVAHGGDPGWNARVVEVAGQVRTGGPVEVSFLMGPGAKASGFDAAVERLARSGVERIVVVPLLVSSHSGHYEQIRWLAGQTDSLSEAMRHHLEMAGHRRASAAVPIRITPALDDADELARVLADRALAAGGAPDSQALFLVAHGPNSAEDHAAWMGNLRRVAGRVQQLAGFRDVRVDLVRDDAPGPVRAEAVQRIRDVIELQGQATGRAVVVVPVLVSAGPISRSKLPSDLAGLSIVYRGDPLLPHPAMARWIERQVARAASLPGAGPGR
jgi:sirohydrochlorin cobaltochelatase